MASVSTKAAVTKSILTPSITLRGHGEWIDSISYFPDGQRMISGSYDKTARQWDLKACKEIEEARGVYEGRVCAVAVSRDGRWVVTGGGNGELKACEVETGIVETFGDRSDWVYCIDISEDNTLLAGGGERTWIWNLDTGRLVAGPFGDDESVAMGAVRFSTDSKKLAVKLASGKYLEVWDIKTHKLDARVGGDGILGGTLSPVFWTNNDKTIIAAFSFPEDDPIKTIYEFDASTLETVGTPFEGHTELVTGLTLSFDGALLASASHDNTIKLWAFESRQVLASFDAQNPLRLTFSPDSSQLACTTTTKNDYKIFICDTPLDILAQARIIARKKSTLNHLLNSDATRRPPAGHRRQPISAMPMVQRPPPTRDPQQPSFLSKLLRFSPRTNSLRPGQPRDPLAFPATSPLPSSLSGQAAPRFNHFEISSPSPPSNRVTQSLRQHLPFLAPRQSLGSPVVEVAPGRKFTRLAAAKLPEYTKVDDTRHPSTTVPQENDSSDVDSLPDVHWCKAFLCYMSCWSHGTLRMPPRWRLERVDIHCQDGTADSSRLASQSQPEAGPSRLAAANHLEAQSSSI